MADAAKEQARTFTVTIKSSDGNCEKIVQELVNKCLGKDNKKEKQKACCCKCRNEKKAEEKCVTTHKPEPYVKPEVDKRMCRDIYCKTHYQRPVIQALPSTGQRPPFFPPPPPPPPYMGSHGSENYIIRPSPYMASYDSVYLRPPMPYGFPPYRPGW